MGYDSLPRLAHGREERSRKSENSWATSIYDYAESLPRMEILRLDSLHAALRETPLAEWAGRLPDTLPARWWSRPHGDRERWRALLASLPPPPAGEARLDADRVGVVGRAPLDAAMREELTRKLQGLHPWRKGPFELHGIHIDSEWRSDWKWRRLAPHIQPLHGRLVLDVGCGNGYHLWRMAGAGARHVIGIDPSELYLYQFAAIRHFIGAAPVHLLPLGIEDLPARLGGFDTVFSMGVLYHRRSPIDHLRQLAGLLRPGGELVLETLVVDGDETRVLVPEGRYARMRNVWFLPSCGLLERWCRRIGLRQPRVVDITATTCDEQRATAWMRFESLAQCLDPGDPERTVEGYPAPKRAILIARRR